MGDSSAEEEEGFNPDLARLFREHRVVKSHIETTLNMMSRRILERPFFMRYKITIEHELGELHSLEREITQILPNFEDVQITQRAAVEYEAAVMDRLIHMEENLPNEPPVTSTSPSLPTEPSRVEPVIEHPKLTLKLPSFSGAANEDRFAFRDFFNRFEICVAGIPDKARKLAHLQDSLTGKARRLVGRLQLSAENYDVALEKLRDEYLDRDAMKEEIFAHLIEFVPKFNKDLNLVREYLSRVGDDLIELKDLVNLDFMAEETGNALMSFLVFRKLPSEVKRDLIRVAETDYPDLKQILNETPKIISSLQRARDIQSGGRFNQKNEINSPVDTAETSHPSPKATLGSFHNTVKKGYAKHCKFCNADGHTAPSCRTYNTLAAREGRCRELNLCERCTSSQHAARSARVWINWNISAVPLNQEDM